MEAVAAQRRALPLGGEIPEDYAFDEIVGDNGEGEIRTVRISELFAKGMDSLIVYSFMYGPEMARPCPSCTSIFDALDGEAAHVVRRTNLAVVAKSPIKRIREFAADLAPLESFRLHARRARREVEPEAVVLALASRAAAVTLRLAA